MTAAPSKDFRRLRESGNRAGVSRAIGDGFIAARDRVARVLLRLGATPNHVTFAGFLFTVGAGWCLAHGAGQQLPWMARGEGPAGPWPMWAALLLIGAGGCDMLDGAVARLGSLHSRFGGVFDSVLDRCSDIAIFLGCVVYFGAGPHASLTHQVLAIVTMCNAFLTSYVKARAEVLIPSCEVGYWLRGERFAAVLIGCLSGHVPAVLWQLATVGALTPLRRVVFSWLWLRSEDRGRPRPPAGPGSGAGRLLLWRYPRGSIPYDFVTGLNIAYIIFAPLIWPGLNAA